ncbi:odorant receptor 4-like [Danaus plexippus]|uniref:odorant receptor 4-like n=1 Tax=Danaus plexippus TaxID=13037 RepID=UPI002AB2442A|nr:odorant receptor 4-like [Danaus plexippus]
MVGVYTITKPTPLSQVDAGLKKYIDRDFKERQFDLLLRRVPRAVFQAIIGFNQVRNLYGVLGGQEMQGGLGTRGMYEVHKKDVVTRSIIKATVVCTKKTEIESIVEGLGAIWRTDEMLTKNQIEKKQYRLKKFNFYLTVFYWGSMVASYQNLFTTICTILFKRLVLQQDPELEFAFGNAYPYDFTKNWFTYLSVYSFQCFSVLRFIYVYLGTECLMITLCSQLSTDFALLQEDLKRCKIVVNENGSKKKSQLTTSETETTETSIKVILSHHQKLISLVKTLNMIFNQLVCSDFVFATVLICFFCFGASVAQETTEFLKNFSAVLALMGPIYILCYYAEQLQEESVGIANAAYETLWYEGDKTFQKNIFLLILRSQRACCLTSLNYAPISLNSFTKIISKSYSYYSLIKTMYMAQNTGESLKCLAATIAILLPIYMLCFYAHLLEEESTGIMNSAYDTLWYNGNQQFQKSIYLTILRSQKPCSIMSLNYARISLSSFTKIVSTSYSYYSLVRTMYAEKA